MHLLTRVEMLLGNFMKMSSTFDGAGQALSEITTGLLPSLMVSCKVLTKLMSIFCVMYAHPSICYFRQFMSEWIWHSTRHMLLPIFFVRHNNYDAITLFFMQFLADILPKESIVWKMKMLRTASSFVNSRLHAVKAQSLVLARYDLK